ncbi:MAG: ketoacyl-ACP synthase III [Ginsengibacter sp.]
MAFLSISNVLIQGISACVPKQRNILNASSSDDADLQKLIKTTGIHERRLTSENICTSDLCLRAAEKLIEELRWKKDEIEVLIFVTQTPDYILPATSALLQYKLGLSTNCLTLDISLGCSGYVYGLVTIAGLISGGTIKKGLLLVGDTISKTCSPDDKSTFPLFGDAGTATALSYNTLAAPIFANLCSDGHGFESIIIKEGGYRNQFNSNSLKLENIEKGISRNNCQLVMNGMDVFSFGISKAPEVVNNLINEFHLNKDSVDYFIFHQANLFMNEKIRKKLSIPPEKVPYSLEKFGNTSCATIPLTINTQLKEEITTRELIMILCGFGVGLSWGAVYIKTNNLISPDLIEYD